jgi:hypothetical protein
MNQLVCGSTAELSFGSSCLLASIQVQQQHMIMMLQQQHPDSAMNSATLSDFSLK